MRLSSLHSQARVGFGQSYRINQMTLDAQPLDLTQEPGKTVLTQAVWVKGLDTVDPAKAKLTEHDTDYQAQPTARILVEAMKPSEAEPEQTYRVLSTGKSLDGVNTIGVLARGMTYMTSALERSAIIVSMKNAREGVVKEALANPTKVDLHFTTISPPPTEPSQSAYQLSGIDFLA